MNLNLSVPPLTARERLNPSSAHAKQRRRHQRRGSRQRGRTSQHRATLHQATIDRLFHEAEHDPRFEGMSPEEIRAFLEPRIERFVGQQPWWFGHFGKRPSSSSRPKGVQPEALKRYQAERRQEEEARHARLTERLKATNP